MDATSNASTLTGLVVYAMALPVSAVVSRAASRYPCQTHARCQMCLKVTIPATSFVSIPTGFVADAPAIDASAVAARALSPLLFRVTTAESADALVLGAPRCREAILAFRAVIL